MSVPQLIYLDNAATTPMLEEVIQEMHVCMREVYGNPSSVHAPGRKARVELEKARRGIARLLQVSPGEIFFTSGGTEAINAILWGCLRDLKRTHFISSPLEHPAVLQTLEAMAAYENATLSLLDVDQLGHTDMQHLEFLLKQHPASVVCLMHANNEIGNLLPVNEVGSLCAGHNALFLSDTVQTMGKFRMNLNQLPFDFAVGSAHKFHGPKGVGFMYVRQGKFFHSFIRGGGQERNMRAGTENLYGIMGMSKALELMYDGLEGDRAHILGLRELLMGELAEKIPGASFNGDVAGSCLHTIVNISLPALDQEMLLPSLDIEGICVSSGSACSSGSSKQSHVLTAIGANPQRASLRVSFSRFSTAREVLRLVQVLKQLLDKNSS